MYIYVCISTSESFLASIYFVDKDFHEVVYELEILHVHLCTLKNKYTEVWISASFDHEKINECRFWKLVFMRYNWQSFLYCICNGANSHNDNYYE